MPPPPAAADGGRRQATKRESYAEYAAFLDAQQAERRQRPAVAPKIGARPAGAAPRGSAAARSRTYHPSSGGAAEAGGGDFFYRLGLGGEQQQRSQRRADAQRRYRAELDQQRAARAAGGGAAAAAAPHRSGRRMSPASSYRTDAQVAFPGDAAVEERKQAQAEDRRREHLRQIEEQIEERRKRREHEQLRQTQPLWWEKGHHIGRPAPESPLDERLACSTRSLEQRAARARADAQPGAGEAAGVSNRSMQSTTLFIGRQEGRDGDPGAGDAGLRRQLSAAEEKLRVAQRELAVLRAHSTSPRPPSYRNIAAGAASRSRTLTTVSRQAPPRPRDGNSPGPIQVPRSPQPEQSEGRRGHSAGRGGSAGSTPLPLTQHSTPGAAERRDQAERNRARAAAALSDPKFAPLPKRWHHQRPRGADDGEYTAAGHEWRGGAPASPAPPHEAASPQPPPPAPGARAVSPLCPPHDARPPPQPPAPPSVRVADASCSPIVPPRLFAAPPAPPPACAAPPPAAQADASTSPTLPRRGDFPEPGVRPFLPPPAFLGSPPAVDGALVCVQRTPRTCRSGDTQPRVAVLDLRNAQLNPASSLRTLSARYSLPNTMRTLSARPSRGPSATHSVPQPPRDAAPLIQSLMVQPLIQPVAGPAEEPECQSPQTDGAGGGSAEGGDSPRSLQSIDEWEKGGF